ncbi:hypothetical protein POM88_042582 [Heracleum sosnowskyi]|uniref:Uncharacterized protein n=1 Tax=Heracleum sosnowskyi TaxID=360622 RepID=A0AAD8MAS7_9APIA|nr:hypothetical protein POM88_042582 [Heracleum sosnowskyi]
MTDDARRSESQRLLAIAAKLLETRDLTGAKDFATSAQDADPLLDGSDQILAIADVLLAGDKKVNEKFNCTCGRAIHAVEVPSLPAIVKGEDGFNCFWGCFPMGYGGGSGMGVGMEFPNWMPPFFPSVGDVSGGEGGGFGNVNVNVPEVGKGRNVKVSPVNGSAKADFQNLNVSQDEYVTKAPVYNVTSVQKPGTRKRGRPRKNPIK